MCESPIMEGMEDIVLREKDGVGSMHFTTRWSHMLGWEDCLYIYISYISATH